MSDFFKKNDKSVGAEGMFADFNAISVSIASPERIRSWSSGEVKRPETINYRTGKPERGGLFCARIFGPVRDYECMCGKYKRHKHANTVCEKCGVEVCLSRVRRFRMGHVELAVPVAHIWFTKSVPSRVGILLGLSVKELDAILYFEKHVVVDPGTTSLEKNQLLTAQEYELWKVECEDAGDAFVALVGADAIRRMLSDLNLSELEKELVAEIASTNSDLKKKKAMKRLDLVRSFIRTGNKPEWMVLTVLPILPPDLRPLVPLDGGRYAVSDSNDLYRRVINRNNRLRKLIDSCVPEIVVRNEKRMLQEAVDALFDNSKRNRPILGANKRPLKSLSDSFRGKQGRFRQNLLGKRVDYSGRSVIIVGNNLKLHQCGLPREMALELFRPMIFAALRKYGYTQTLQGAKKMIEAGANEVWDVLDEVVSGYVVLLNRAPTLHRQSIQAFEVVLIDGKAIQLHPLVCGVFNADFDGDQMAVHVPLCVEAQVEARILMMSSKNIRSPANGNFSIVPTKDMILGLYYLTYMVNANCDNKQCKRFASVAEVLSVLNNKCIALSEKIVLRMADHGQKVRFIETTPGRCVLFDAICSVVPDIIGNGFVFDDINLCLSSKTIKGFFSHMGRNISDEHIVKIADVLKDIGFEYATISGISIGPSDMVTPDDKSVIVEKTEELVQHYKHQFDSGLLTDSERYNKVVAAWSKVSDDLFVSLMKKITQQNGGFDNDIYMISSSGARGSEGQIRQLCAIRGMMTDTKDEVLEFPIIHSLKEGMNVHEFFLSTRGARKGLADVALKTANSGYLTRRLVDVAQDCVVRIEDCGCESGIVVRCIKSGHEVIASLSERIFGRYLAKDVMSKSGKLLYKRNVYISEEVAKDIEANVDFVYVRSPLLCNAEGQNVCQKCYGLDFSKGRVVDLHVPVGIIGAQSISEPGTQLTMRSFHAGGSAHTDAGESAIVASFDGKVVFDNCKFVETDSGLISVGMSSYIILLDDFENEVARYKIPYGSNVDVSNGQRVTSDHIIARWDPYAVPVVAEISGSVSFKDLIDGISMKEVVDESTGISSISVLDWKRGAKADKMSPSIIVTSSDGQKMSYPVAPHSVLLTFDGDNVSAGDILARLPKEMLKSKDITGGLQRVSDLFEVKKQKDVGVMVFRGGVIELDSDGASVVYVKLPSGDRDSYFLPRSRVVIVQNGDKVRAGDLITDGEASLHDMLAILGVERFADFFINEAQGIYRMQGIKINDKHFEVVIRQMVLRLRISSSGDSKYEEGMVVNVSDYLRVCRELVEQGKVPPVGVRLLEPITKASLSSDSYISAASFRASTQVITDAAINGMVDLLTTNKAVSVSGGLIAAGTGAVKRWIDKQQECAK